MGNICPPSEASFMAGRSVPKGLTVSACRNTKNSKGEAGAEVERPPYKLGCSFVGYHPWCVISPGGNLVTRAGGNLTAGSVVYYIRSLPCPFTAAASYLVHGMPFKMSWRHAHYNQVMGRVPSSFSSLNARES